MSLSLRQRLSVFLFSIFACPPGLVLAAPVDIEARAIDRFLPGSDETRFGSFEFLGGLELWSNEPLFGAWSSIRFLADGQKFIGVLDTGHWIEGTVGRENGRIAGIHAAAITPMMDASGRLQQGKYLMDAESLAIAGDRLIVGFEQAHRIDVYPLAGYQLAAPRKNLALPFPPEELRGNGGMETLAVAPDGRLVTVAERSIDDKGHLFAGIVEGEGKGEMRVMRHGGYDVTDGAFLPDGDLLLLERRFSLASGIAMRLRRIDGSGIKAGAVLDGDVVLEAAYGHQIDNMEGLDVVPAADGSIHVILVSDDNHSILQRSLILEFRLIE